MQQIGRVRRGGPRYIAKSRPMNQAQSAALPSQHTSKRIKNKKKLASQANMIHKVLTYGLEKEYFANSYSQTIVQAPVLGSNCFQCITLIPQGPGDSQREGDQVTLSSLDINYYVFQSLSSIPMYQLIRVIVFQWNQDTVVPSAAPTYDQILLIGANGGDATRNVICPYSHDYRHNFRILYDKWHTVTTANSSVANGNAVSPVINVRINKFMNPKIAFHGGGTNGRNHCYVMMLCRDVTTNPTGVFVFKTNYRDG